MATALALFVYTPKSSSLESGDEWQSRDYRCCQSALEGLAGKTVDMNHSGAIDHGVKSQFLCYIKSAV